MGKVKLYDAKQPQGHQLTLPVLAPGGEPGGEPRSDSTAHALTHKQELLQLCSPPRPCTDPLVVQCDQTEHEGCHFILKPGRQGSVSSFSFPFHSLNKHLLAPALFLTLFRELGTWGTKHDTVVMEFTF